MSEIKITFNVTVHFENGESIVRNIPLKKAIKYVGKENLIIPEDSELVEINGVSESIIVPLNMIFVIPIAPKFRNTESVSRFMLYRRDEGKCAYCGIKLSEKEATVDHVIPRSKGGKTVWENIALSCGKCNRKKGNRTPKEAGMKLTVKLYNPKKHKK